MSQDFGYSEEALRGLQDLERRCRVETLILPRRNKGPVVMFHKFAAPVCGYGLRQEFITPHGPQQNGMMERFIRSLIERCTHRQSFESLAHASLAIGG